MFEDTVNMVQSDVGTMFDIAVYMLTETVNTTTETVTERLTRQTYNFALNTYSTFNM